MNEIQEIEIEGDQHDKNGLLFKQLAIIRLYGTMRKFGDKILPHFSRVAASLGVEKYTLHRWWQYKEEILSTQPDALFSHLVEVSKGKVKLALTLVHTELLSRVQDPISVADLSVAELLKIEKTLFNDDRILNGLPTGIVEHDVILPFAPNKVWDDMPKKLPAKDSREKDSREIEITTKE